jgi:hypothetical protein
MIPEPGEQDDADDDAEDDPPQAQAAVDRGDRLGVLRTQFEADHRLARDGQGIEGESKGEEDALSDLDRGQVRRAHAPWPGTRGG